MGAGLPKAFLDAVDRTLRLVRDPRAVVNSRVRGHMCSNKKISACARTVCKRMAAKDADEERLGLLSRGDYRVVYYERLVTKTAAELDGISHWRGRGKLGVPDCVEIKILLRAESSHRPPRHRRGACSMAWRCRFLTARPSQDGRVIAEK